MENNSNIKEKAISSVIWKFMERIGAQSVSLIVSIVIARLLDPTDYSVVSLVTIFFVFANVLISGGLNTALIQKKNADKEDYSSVLFISLFLSIAIYLVLFFFSPIIANVYNKNELVLIIRIMGLSLPITAIKSIWCAYISSNLLFKKFFLATLGGTVISAVVGICLAVNGAGAWALVAQQMANTIIDTIILVVSTRIPLALKISFQRLKTLFKYGWKVLASSLIGTIYTQIVPLVIGYKYNDSDLSYYTKGKSFPDLISATTTNTLAAVMFPTMSKFQDEKEKLLNYTRLFIRVSSFIVFPLMIGFLVVSDNFILVLLTEKWLPAATYIKIFCLASMFDMVHIGNCETIKAMGKSGVYLIMEIIKKTGYFITIFLFMLLTNTPEMLSIAFFVCTIIALVVNSIPNRKLLGYRFRDQIKDLMPNLFFSLIMGIFVYTIGKIEVNVILLLVIQIIAGVCSYSLMSLLFNKSSLIFIQNSLKGLFRKKQ